MVSGQLPPPDNWPPDNCLLDDCPLDNCPPDNCPQGKLSPGQLPPHHKISVENNCPHSSKFPSKSTMSELRKTMHCLRVHGVILGKKNPHIT